MAPTPAQRSNPSSSRPLATAGGGSVDSALDVRYGRTKSFRLRRRFVALIVGILIALIFGAWVVWAGFDGTSASVDTNDAGYVIKSNSEAVVTSEISVDAGTRVDCAVEVLNSSFDVVGWKIVKLPPSAQSNQVITTDIHTTNRGVTGLIDKCWLP